MNLMGYLEGVISALIVDDRAMALMLVRLDLDLLDSLAQERREALEGMVDPSPRISEELLNKAFGS